MADSLDFDGRRPAKRIKRFPSPALHHHCGTNLYSVQQGRHLPPPLQQLHQQQQQHQSSPAAPQQPLCYLPADAASASLVGVAIARLETANDSPRNGFWPNDNVIGLWKWPPSVSTFPPPSHLNFGASDDNFETGHILLSPQQSVASGPIGVDSTPVLTSSVIPTTSQLDLSSANPSDSFASSQQTQLDAVSALLFPEPPIAFDGLSPSIPECKHHDDYQAPRSSGTPNNNVLYSPFRDCIGTFGLFKSQTFRRPLDGKVNGYVKFSWPKDSLDKKPPISGRRSVSDIARVTEIAGPTKSTEDLASQSLVTIIGPSPVPPSGDNLIEFTTDIPGYFPSSLSFMSQMPAVFTTSPVLLNAFTEIASMGAPTMLPSQYGYEAKMDDTDRRLWMFYIRNWCPGRSVLEETNLWLKDFAQMHKSLGIRSAIISLAGIYIYDYLPIDSIRNRVNKCFSNAEQRFSQLLNDPATAQDEASANELITIAAILSMQDIVLTERRLRGSFSPRWLQGCREGERLLHATDHGSRFWKSSNVQTSSLRNSQSIIVGRTIILAQPMSSLPAPDKFDTEQEACRFGWLLYGPEKDLYKIHGGCGFSKKLLHLFSQITYCAARLQQETETPIIPLTARYLQKELLTMKQWNSESSSWEAARYGPSVIEWVRSKPENYQIGSNASMTDVTAEAWRLAAILYLQCRVFRLSRNHPDVLSKVDDLAKCNAIMPTSGSHFTAQAPLFPVFLLGVLATVPDHKAVASKWFEEVLQTPVRSSVPPLHKALLHIWSWIDREIPLPSAPALEMNESIHLRQPWWEQLVTEVQQQEQELLCLT